MDLTQAPFRIGDRVRIAVHFFDEPYTFGAEFIVTSTEVLYELQRIGVDGGSTFLVPSDLELVERVS